MPITRLSSKRDFFRILLYWKMHAMAVFLLIIAAVMLYAYMATPEYESSAEILVLPRTNEGAVISSGLDESRIRPVTTNDVYTEMELVGSESVLKDTVQSFADRGMGLSNGSDSILAKICSAISEGFHKLLVMLKLTPPPGSNFNTQVSFLRGSLNIEPVLDSNIIQVALRGEKPKETEIVLSRLLNIYLRHRNGVFTKEEGLQFYHDQAAEYGKKLDAAESNLKAFQKEWSIVNLEGQNQSNIELLTRLNNDLKMLEISYDETLGRISMLKKRLLRDAGGLYLTKEMREIPVIVELEKGIVPLLIKKSEITKAFTEESREYQAIDDQIAMLRGEIRKEIEKAIRTDELELESMGIKIESLRRRIGVLKAEANEFNQKEKVHQELQRQVKLYRDNYLLYSNKAEGAKIVSEKSKRDLANVSVASGPTVPESPVFPNRLLMLVLSIVFGAFVALFTPFVLESLDSKLKSADDIESLLALPVISSFPDVAKR